MSKYDMPTNEGSLALARSVATGSKLVIRGAALCNYTGAKMDTVSKVASLTWSDISGSAIDGGIMPCTSYLPSMVDYMGVETNRSIAALDIEFTYMPSVEVSYNTIAVLADMYYPIGPFKLGSHYSVGTVVWYTDNSGAVSYYKCIQDNEGASIPANEPNNWESTTVVHTLDGTYGNLQYSSISTDPILLYVSKTSGVITISPQMEIDYKVRLYIEGVDKTSNIQDFVVFDTLGPEFMASAQLNLLAEFASQLRRVRDVAMVKASRS